MKRNVSIALKRDMKSCHPLTCHQTYHQELVQGDESPLHVDAYTQSDLENTSVWNITIFTLD